MAHRVVSALVSSIGLLVAQVTIPCFAQDSVKHAVFEDCDRALKEFSSQSVEQQSALSDFLARVLALNTQSPSAPEVFAAAPALPGGGESSGLAGPKTQDLVTGALWHNLDAKRELRAKRCALELLRTAGGLAVQTLPVLATIYSEQPLSDEIAVGVEETAADVAERAHKQDMTPTDEHYAALTPILFSQRPRVARQIVQEFVASALPSILKMLPTTKAAPDEVSSFLKEVDPSGQHSMRAFIQMTEQLSPEAIEAIAPHITLPDRGLLTLFINDFVRLAHQSDAHKVFAVLLGSACAQLNGFTVDAAQQNVIATIPDLFSPGILSVEQVACLVGTSTAAARKLPALLTKEAVEDQARHATEIANVAFPILPAEVRADVCARARERALDLASATAPATIRLLKNCTDQRLETAQTAVVLLKNLAALSDVSRKATLYSEILELLEVIGLGKEPNKFATYIKPVLENPAPSQLCLKLASKVPQLEAEVHRRALEVPPSPASLSALQALRSLQAFPRKHTQALIDLLRYPEVQPIGEDILRLLGQPSIAPLRKAAARPAWSGRASALSALIALGAASKSEMSEMATRLATQEGCSFVTAHPQTLCSLADRDNKDISLRPHIESAVKRCVTEMPSQQLSVIAACDKELILNAADQIAGYITLEGDHDQFAAVTRALTSGDLTIPDQLRLLTILVERGSQSTLETILPFISSLHAPPREVLDAVKSVADRNRETRTVYLSALRVLAVNGYAEYDWVPFIRDTMSVTGRGLVKQDALEIVTHIRADTVLAEVIPALESNSPEKLIGAALVGAALGAKAVPIVSRLWHLRENKTPAVRYAAVLALLQINPLTPDIQQEVRNLLVNRYFPTATALPIKWAETVAVVDMDRGSFGDLRKHRLERLLAPTR